MSSRQDISVKDDAGAEGVPQNSHRRNRRTPSYHTETHTCYQLRETAVFKLLKAPPTPLVLLPPTPLPTTPGVDLIKDPVLIRPNRGRRVPTLSTIPVPSEGLNPLNAI